MPPRSRVCAVIDLVKAFGSDAYLLAWMRRAVWMETYQGIYPESMWEDYDVEAYAQRDRQRMDSPVHHYYFFMDGDMCAGYFSFGPYNFGTYKDFSLCLNNLYILKNYKGMGLGKRAFAVIRDYCAQQGIDRFFCGCNANNLPAIDFYRHMGGIQGDKADSSLPKEDQIIHFEFYLGE